MTLLEELTARGFVQDVTDRDALAKALEGSVTFYCGFDPSGASLHLGQLMPFALMTHLSRAGHKPIALVGGATGMVGDPSGKSEERKLLDPAALAANLAAVTAQVKRFLPDALVVNNAEWTEQLSYLDFLRDVGKLITVNYMLAKESVRARLEDREQGISYTEFSYMLLQAFDFAHLARAHGCRLQVGGSDQWGNITCGIELSRKMGNPNQLLGLVFPLLMSSSGKKFGKTEAGTSVWLDGRLTSPYRFFQYWINTEDESVGKYLRLFTFLPLAEIDALLAEHEQKPSARKAQRKLANEVTTWVHGADAARRASRASEVIFGEPPDALTDADLAPLLEDLPSTELPRAELGQGLPLVDLLVRVKLADSKAAARRLLQQGGVYINNVRVDDVARAVGAGDLATESMFILRAGKKSYHVVRVT